MRGRKGKKTFSEFDCDNLLRLAAGCQRRPLVSDTQTRLEGDRGGVLTAVEVRGEGGGRFELIASSPAAANLSRGFFLCCVC